MDLAVIRAAVKTALDDIEIRVYDYMTFSPDAPAALVYPESIPPEETMGGLIRPVIIVQLLASMNVEESATRLVDGWISTGTETSIIDRIAASDEINCSSPAVRNYVPKLSLDGGSSWLTAELVFDVF